MLDPRTAIPASDTDRSERPRTAATERPARKGRPNTLGKRIAIRRRLLELEQDQLARLCGTTGARVRDWEADRRVPDAAGEIDTIAAVLEVSVEWLTTGNGSFGQRLRQRRQQLGITMYALARRLGDEVSVRSVRNWETDSAWPKKSKQAQIADRLNVPLEWLLTGTGLPTATKLVVQPASDAAFLDGIAQLKMAFGLRFDREAERLLQLQDGAVRRAREGKEGLPVHAKYAIAAALGWSFDQELVYAMLSEVQRAKIERMTAAFDDIDSVREVGTRKRQRET